MRERTRPSPGAASVSKLCLHVSSTLGLLLSCTQVTFAHEPLWGETPAIFGPRVFHPEVRFGLTRHGAAPGANGEASRELESEYGLQYGINRFVNVRLSLPAIRTDLEDEVGGITQRTRVSGVGDALLSAKYRFRLRQDTGFQRAQALIIGWKLPTGDNDRLSPTGIRLQPGDQPGSGRHGVEMGYALDSERLIDSAWASAFYTHEFGDGFRRGDAVEVDAAYGRWIVRPNTAEDLGINLAFGMHAEAMADDRLEGNVSAGNAHRVVGLHVTPIITKGRTQYRVGVFVPLWKSGDEAETDFNYELRAGWEMFF